MLSFIFNSQKTIEVILYLRNNNRNPTITSIFLETKITYAHMQKILKTLSKLKMIKSVKTGRTRHVELNNRGKLIAENFYKLNELLTN